MGGVFLHIGEPIRSVPKYLKKNLDILAGCAILFSVMRNRMKNQHIDWLNTQDDRVIAPVEGTHDGYRVVKAMRVSDGWAEERAVEAQEAQDEMDGDDGYAYDVIEEDCGWFGYEGLCED